MEITVSEMFLIVWASVMTVLYLITKSSADDFKSHTLYKLRQVSEGKAKVVFDGTHISIVNKE